MNKKIKSITNFKCKLYETFYPNFKSITKPSRTESFDSDLTIDRNGRRKTKFFGMIRLFI